ncbi:YjhT family mutarotase (plasmid) [Deinococcus metallilatus]|uniref:N-acetylneuraminate epimerase n=1 Tax=Deinococcus metallilatus TaxID=1211322 RepID=A0ABR6MYF3_9DEIO|nr:N-acetylneuraminate epimerase [Deinococcus metallilatus]MBB5296959.1 N-acetylneuraminate epimerase [Deinococcus metallilatus]QBY06673.1 YjhT family mutarotase [Deinococcus metallilatus]GMA15142.1 N-acetylneuraminate epimerase [Deinococcus metallilatus]
MYKTGLALALLAAAALGSAQAQVYPDLPVAIKNGTGVMIGQTIYVGLGTAGNQWFALDLSQPERHWVLIAPFPGVPRDQSISAAVDGKLYVFGGIGKPTPTSTTTVFNQGFVYDPAKNTWTQLPTRAPEGIAGGVAATVGDSLLMFAGVNKNIFDGYFTDLAAGEGNKAEQDRISRAYFDQRPQDYFLGREVMSYTPADNRWQEVDFLPFGGTAGSALVARGNTLTLVGGEIKPGVRTPAVRQGQLGPSGITWRPLPDMPGPVAGEAQEGLAGAYAGYSHGALLVAGGANFPGARARLASGLNYAHEGLTKTWRKDVYALVDGQWKVVGALPQAQGYGLAVPYGDEVILVGGELQGGQATPQVMSLEWQGDALKIKD